MGVNLDFPKALGVNVNTARGLLNKDWPQYDIQEKSITFVGGTTNAIGDYNGTGNPVTLFTVTGVVEISIIAFCTTTLTIDATATAEVGTALSVAGLIADTAGDAIDVNEIWHDASPDASVELTSVIVRNIVSQDIILTVTTANILTGVIKFMVKWAPISSDGNVIAA